MLERLEGPTEEAAAMVFGDSAARRALQNARGVGLLSTDGSHLWGLVRKTLRAMVKSVLRLDTIGNRDPERILPSATAGNILA